MITASLLNGHKALWLENEQLKLAVLPEKGADIPLMFHQPSGKQLLLQTPHGLQPPGKFPQSEFLENYEGGYQELFPSCGGPCDVDGLSLPEHGEVALLPWEYEISGRNDLRLWVTCRQLPFRLERRMRLRSARLEMDEQVTNIGPEERPFVWGHHFTLGGDFLEEGCRVEMPAGRIATPAVLYEPETARLEENQWETWPFARGRREGEIIDLSHVGGPRIHSHDDAFITMFTAGRLSVINPRLKMHVSLAWDAAVFPWVTYWMPYGGADLPPLTGAYGVGIEPWVYCGNLAEALKAGEALHLGAGQSLRTAWSVHVDDQVDP